MSKLTVQSIVVGIDVHKYSHTAVAMDCLGQKISNLSFSNEELEHCVSWLSSLGVKERLIIGLEDTNGNGFHLTSRLQQEGFYLHYVPPILTDRARKHSVYHDKSDDIDAMRVGKAIITKSEEALPADNIIPNSQGSIRLIDLLVQERQTLIKEQTALKNQLHALLHQYYGNNYHHDFKNIFSAKALLFYEKEINNTDNFLSGSILRRIERLKVIQKQIKEIDKSLKSESTILPSISKLHTNLVGCGLVTACKIIAEIGEIDRFTTQNHLAMYAGIAPVKYQSGKSERVHTNPAGNRRLNQAIHTIALSQIGNNGKKEAKDYYQKKLAEGKSKLWALRCLKRQIVKSIFEILLIPDTN